MNRLYTYKEIEKIQEYAREFKADNTVGFAYFETNINEEQILLLGNNFEKFIDFINDSHIAIKNIANELLKENLDSVVLAAIRYISTAHNSFKSNFMSQFKISNPLTGKKYAVDVIYKRIDSPLDTGHYGVFIEAQLAQKGEVGESIGWNGNLIDSYGGFNDIGFGYIFDRIDRVDNMYLSNSAKALLSYEIDGNFVSLVNFAKFMEENTHFTVKHFLSDMQKIFDNIDHEFRYKFSVVKKSSVTNMDIIIRCSEHNRIEPHKVLSITIIDNTDLHQRASEAKEAFRFFKGGVITWYPLLDQKVFRVSKITSFVFDDIVDYDTYTIKYDDLIRFTSTGVANIKESSIENELMKLKEGLIEETKTEFEFVRDGDIVVLSTYASIVERTFEGMPAKVVISFLDISEERKLTDELARTYKIDPLTTIFNRASYYEDCKDLEGTLLGIDIDDFKDINDTHGHEVGDEYLIETAEVLRVFADKHNGKAYRIGGDEFVVSIPKILMPEEQNFLCEELIELRIMTNKYGNNAYDISFTIGAASTYADNITPRILYELSDIALYNAKRVAKGSYSVATEKDAEHYLNQKKVESSINRAIKNNEFFPKYVPRFDIQGNIIGLEIDASWKDDNGRDLASYDFMSHMYRMNVVHQLDTMVLGKALEELKYAISELKLDPKYFSVTGYASKSTVLSNDLKKLITQHSTINNNLSSYLEVDIPEISISLKTIKVVSEVNKVAKLRVGISLQVMDENDIEDIMNYLEIVKPNALVFNARVTSAINYKRSDEIITNIMGIARDLKINFYVVGIDTKEEEEFYKKQGFVVFQGNYFSPSLTIIEAMELIKKQKS